MWDQGSSARRLAIAWFTLSLHSIVSTYFFLCDHGYDQILLIHSKSNVFVSKIHSIPNFLFSMLVQLMRLRLALFLQSFKAGIVVKQIANLKVFYRVFF